MRKLNTLEAVLLVLTVYVTTLFPPVAQWAHLVRRGFRQAGTFGDLLGRVPGFFVDRAPDELLYEQLNGMQWLPRVVLFVALIALVYHLTPVRRASVHIGGILLAFGIADLVGFVVAMLNFDGSFSYVLDATNADWTSDALFLGLPIALLFPLWRWWASRIWRVKTPDDSEPLAGRRAGSLALYCVLPVLVLAFAGGLVESGPFARFALYLKLRLRPQADPDNGPDAVVGLDQWLPEAISAVLFIVVVWLLLRRVLNALPVGFFGIWAAVVAASVVGGLINVIVATIFGDGEVLATLVYVMPNAIRFAVLWGWLPAAIGALAHRRMLSTSSVPGGS